jgi:signal peptidase II
MQERRPGSSSLVKERKWSGWLWLSGVASIVVAIDQVTKNWALQNLEDQPAIDLVGSLRLNFLYNEGVAFGIGDGSGWSGAITPLIVAVVIVSLVAYLARSSLIRFRSAALVGGLIVGGGVGNLIDRLIRSEGAVVDFIDVQWWPVFNVADACIVIGVIVFLVIANKHGELSK